MNDLLVKGLRKFLGIEDDEELDEDFRSFSANSEAIVEVVYDRENKEMVVQFTSGAQYTYYNISVQRFNAFKNSASKGKYLNFRIKPAGYIYSRDS